MRAVGVNALVNASLHSPNAQTFFLSSPSECPRGSFDSGQHNSRPSTCMMPWWPSPPARDDYPPVALVRFCLGNVWAGGRTHRRDTVMTVTITTACDCYVCGPRWSSMTRRFHRHRRHQSGEGAIRSEAHPGSSLSSTSSLPTNIWAVCSACPLPVVRYVPRYTLFPARCYLLCAQSTSCTMHVYSRLWPLQIGTSYHAY
jgi:hypothetical protein